MTPQLRVNVVNRAPNLLHVKHLQPLLPYTTTTVTTILWITSVLIVTQNYLTSNKSFR